MFVIRCEFLSNLVKWELKAFAIALSSVRVLSCIAGQRCYTVVSAIF